MKKRFQRFAKESKQNSLLGQKRRFQLMLMLFGLFIFAFTSTMVLASDASVATKTITIAIVPFAGVDLITKAKKVEDMTPEEQALIGTVQKSLQDAIQMALKGYDTASIDLKLKNLQEGLEKDDHPMTKKMQEAIDLVEKSRETINKLGLEIADLKSKGNSFDIAENEVALSLKNAFETDKFKHYANGTAGKNSGSFEINLKNRDMIQKGVVSMGGNSSMTVMPAFQSSNVTMDIKMRSLNLRDFMNVTDASNEEFTSYYFMQIYDINRSAVAVAENGTLPEGSFKVKESSADTKRIGWYIPISNRMLKKVAILQQKILQLLPNGLDRAENAELLFGDGTGNHVTGITKNCLTQTALTGAVYTKTAAAGSIASIATYRSGAAVLVTFAEPFAKHETGMKIIFSGFQTCTALNASTGFIMEVLSDTQIVVPCAFTAETAESVLGNAKFTSYNTWGSFIVDANEGDTLRAIVAFLNFATYMPNLIAVNPITLVTLLSMKDYNGRAMGSEYIQVIGGVPYLDGLIPIAALDCIPKGKVLIGDFMNGCELIDTQKGTIEFAEDVSYKLANQIAAIIQEEIIFAILCPDCFMYADIAAAKALITTESSVTRTMDVNITNTSLPVEITNESLVVAAEVTGPLNAGGTAIMTEVAGA